MFDVTDTDAAVAVPAIAVSVALITNVGVNDVVVNESSIVPVYVVFTPLDQLDQDAPVEVTVGFTPRFVVATLLNVPEYPVRVFAVPPNEYLAP